MTLDLPKVSIHSLNRQIYLVYFILHISYFLQPIQRPVQLVKGDYFGHQTSLDVITVQDGLIKSPLEKECMEKSALKKA